MNNYIRLVGGVVREIIPEFDPTFPGIPLSDRYAPDFIATLTPVDESVEVGLNWVQQEDGTFSPPPPEVEPDTTPNIQAALATIALASMGLQVDEMKQADAGVALLKATGVAPASDAEAPWKAGEYVTVGAVRTVGATGYICLYAHLTGDHWHPTKTLGHVWEVQVSEEGTLESPITFVMGMAVKQGLHYSYNGITYKWVVADIPSCSWAPGSAGVWQWEVATK